MAQVDERIEIRDRIIFNQDKIIDQQDRIINTLRKQNGLMNEVIELQGKMIDALQNNA